MDENWSNRMKMVKLDEKFSDKKMNFWNFFAKISIFEFFWAIWRYFASKRNTG
jgi:hypothetical protein